MSGNWLHSSVVNIRAEAKLTSGFERNPFVAGPLHVDMVINTWQLLISLFTHAHNHYQRPEFL